MRKKKETKKKEKKKEDPRLDKLNTIQLFRSFITFVQILKNTSLYQPKKKNNPILVRDDFWANRTFFFSFI